MLGQTVVASSSKSADLLGETSKVEASYASGRHQNPASYSSLAVLPRHVQECFHWFCRLRIRCNIEVGIAVGRPSQVCRESMTFS